MKNSTKNQNVPLSLTENNNQIYNSELFWVGHPSALVSMWMKYDWFKQSRGEFLAKWIQDAISTKLEARREIISSVLKPIWEDLPSTEKHYVFCKIFNGKNYIDCFHILWDAQDIFDCLYIESAMETFYDLATNKNLKTNYFAAFGLLAAKTS